MIEKINIRLVIVVLIVALFSAGCAVGGMARALVPQCPQGGWQKISNEKSFYICEYTCGDNVVRLREVRLTALGFIGPPLIPLVPVSIKEPEKLLFDIHLVNKQGILPSGAPDIRVKLPSQAQPFPPAEAVHIQSDIGVMKQENIYHMDVLIGGRDSLFKTYLYKFDINRNNIREFDIDFFSDFNGCSIPTIHYEIKTKLRYKPLVPPGG